MLDILMFGFVNFLGLVSPGPDFALVTHYGFTGSRKAAFLASLGITAAVTIHALYCVLGVALFLQTSTTLFTLIQMIGALYLGYIGICLLQKKKEEKVASTISVNGQAFRRGFFTNLLNPKATFFLLTLFTEFVTPTTPAWTKTLYALMIPVSALGWFSFLSYTLTHPKIFKRIQRYQVVFSRSMGAVLLALACYIVWMAF